MALCTAAILVGSAPSDTSAAVGLVKFEARCQADGSILVTWETSWEVDSVAFFLYRAESQDGPWDDYIDFEPAVGNDFTGATYSFVDNEVTPGITDWYRLEELASDDSSSFFGPVRVSAHLVEFRAVRQSDGTVQVTWETYSEPDLAAFFVYRAESPDGPWGDYINFQPASGNPLTGATYSFVDSGVTWNAAHWYRLEEVDDGGNSVFYGPIPVSAHLAEFRARCQADGSILVTWETSSEPDSLAFFLYRAESQNGPWDEYIDFEPAAGNPWTGVAYSFVDYEVTRGVNYWYRLEELAADYSSRWFGPILAGCGRANVPLVLCTP
jgi:hypothetical protein